MGEHDDRQTHRRGTLQSGSKFSRRTASRAVGARPASREVPATQRRPESGATPVEDYDDPRRYAQMNRQRTARAQEAGVAQRIERGVRERLEHGRDEELERYQRGQERPEDGFSRRVAWGRRRTAPADAPRRRHHVGRTILIVLAALIVTCRVIYALVFAPIDQKIAFSATDSQALSGKLSTSMPLTPYYALLLGSDDRENGEPARTDTMMLARVDPVGNKVTLISIPRDSKVQIDGYGTQKVNAAFAIGGAAGAVDAVERLTGIRASHVAVIDFNGLATLIDAIGGIDVNVPVAVNDPEYAQLVLPAGEQHMDGDTAMRFSRVRHGFALGDYQRQADQALVMKAIMEKLRTNPTLLPSAADSMGDAMDTTYHCYDLIPLLLRMSLQSPTIYSASLPSTAKVEGGVSYVIVDAAATKQLMGVVDAGGDPSTVANGYQNGAGTTGEDSASTGGGGTSRSTGTSGSTGSSRSTGGTSGSGRSKGTTSRTR